MVQGVKGEKGEPGVPVLHIPQGGRSYFEMKVHYIYIALHCNHLGFSSADLI